jgi:hypothetical protein
MVELAEWEEICIQWRLLESVLEVWDRSNEIYTGMKNFLQSQIDPYLDGHL